MVSPSECILYHEGVNLNDKLLQQGGDLFPPVYSLLVSNYPMATLPQDKPVYVGVSHCVSPYEFTVSSYIMNHMLYILYNVYVPLRSC